MISDVRFYFRKLGFAFLFDVGIYAILVYRFGRWAYLTNRFFNPAWYLYLIVKCFFQPFSKIELPVSCRIGSNLFLPHPYGLVIGGETEIGNNCTIGPWVVIGRLGKGRGNPSIMDNVYIGPKATILGPITVGSGAIVGANALVIKDVPEGKKVYGTVSIYSE